MPDNPTQCFVCNEFFVSEETFGGEKTAICRYCVECFDKQRRSLSADVLAVKCDFCADILPLPIQHTVYGFKRGDAAICIDCIEVTSNSRRLKK